MRHGACIFAALCLLTVAVVVHGAPHQFMDVLGVPHTADLGVIRRAYRKLSLQYHPDKNKDNADAHQRFIEIVGAYEGLVEHFSAAKTAEDHALVQHGRDGLETIRRFQRQFDKSHHAPGLSGGQRAARAANTEQNAAISYEQFSFGTDLHWSRAKKLICPVCGGKGGHEALSKCSNCGGSGLHMVPTGGGGMTITGCGVCGGSGIVGQCAKCGGSGTVSETKQYHAVVEPGTPIGHKIVFPGDGDESPKAAVPGDYTVELREARHGTFKRQGNVLYFTVRVPRTVQPPVHVSVDGLDGNKLKFVHDGPVNNGDQLTLHGVGLRTRPDNGTLVAGPVTCVFLT